MIDFCLPGGSKPLPPDWALQDPNDYLDVLRTTIPAVLQESGVAPSEVVGVGIDFTACTILPVTRDGTPLCFLEAWRGKPHAWVKLWKHHAAQPQANRIDDVARQRGEPWLERYGGKISSEWLFSKSLQMLEEAPDVYAATEKVRDPSRLLWQGWKRRHEAAQAHEARAAGSVGSCHFRACARQCALCMLSFRGTAWLSGQWETSVHAIRRAVSW